MKTYMLEYNRLYKNRVDHAFVKYHDLAIQLAAVILSFHA